MDTVAIIACFLAAFAVTFSRGAGFAFARVYLPALLLLSKLPNLHLPMLPDATPATASVYGILLGGLAARRWPRFRPAPTDYILVLLLLAYVVSAASNNYLYTGVSVLGSTTLTLVAPYFIARSSLERRAVQREALFALVASSFVMALFALIELRLWPHTYAQMLNSIGLMDYVPRRLNARFGFFRAVGPFIHPIDLGNTGALTLAAIFILALRSGVGVRRLWVRLGLGASFVASLCSLSFSSYFGLAAGLSLYLGLARVVWARRFLSLGVVIILSAGWSYAAYVASAPLPERPTEESAFAESYWVRQLIIKEAWQTASTSGAFGLGGETDKSELDLELKSIDNSFLLIAIERGWVGLGLWMALPFSVALLASRAIRHAPPRDLSRAVRCGFCATLGTMIAMFTVWFGFVYASLFPILVGLAVSAAQAGSAAPREAPLRQRPALPSTSRPLRRA